MPKRIAGIVGIAAALAVVLGGSAAAAPRWQAPQTIDTVRGVPDPQVGIDSSGAATVVFGDTPLGEAPGVFLTRRLPGSGFGAPVTLGTGGEARLAVAPDGKIAIAWRHGDRIEVMLGPSASQARSNGVRQTFVEPHGARDPRIGIDAAGRATIAWRLGGDGGGGSPVQLRAATLALDGAVGGPENIGPAAPCSRDMSLSVNQAGDAVLFCQGRAEAYARAPQGSFESVPVGSAADNVEHVALDGAGDLIAVHVHLGAKGARHAEYRVRARGGTFGPSRPLAPGGHWVDFTVIPQESRTVAVLRGTTGLTYAVRPAGGEFGATRGTDVPGGSGLSAIPVAPLGPLPLLMGGVRDGDLLAAQLDADGSMRELITSVIPGLRSFPVALAGSEGGLAVAAWEQGCGNGYAVMAMVLDERRGTTAPPCQDTAAPKVAVRPQRARLVGRRLRMRIGCDEACRIVVRARVLRGGKGRPLATAKTRRAQPIAARRYRTFALRLTKRQATKARTALAARRRVSVRLALSVRDGFENGAVRRVAVPLRR